MKLKFREATREDLPEIVRMLADDFLGATRERHENPLPESYIKAFEEIEADKNNELIVAFLSEPPAAANGLTRQVQTQAQTKMIQKMPTHRRYLRPLPQMVLTNAEIDKAAIVGTLQITFTPSISFQGGKRATVESVRVDEKYRGHGIGKELMLWAIERAKEENCFAVQLTTNADRKGRASFL